MKRLSAAVVAFAVLLVACDWTQYGFDPAHTRFNSTEATIGPANVASLVERWSTPNEGNVNQQLPPVISRGVVYASAVPYVAGEYLGTVAAYDARHGRRLWVRSTNGVPSAPSVAHGMVYVGSVDHSLYAFDAITGAVRWTAPTIGEVRSPPAVSDGTVFVASARAALDPVEQYLYAFDAMTGQLSWSSPIGPNGSRASPTVANGAVLISSTDGHVRAFDATSGALRWDIGAIGALDTVAYAEGIVYVGTFKGRLVALRVSDGTEAWSMQLVMSGIVEAPAVAGGVVFAQFSSPPYGPHGVGAYHATTGEQLWTAATSVPGGGGISVANGVVYVSLRQQLKVLDARTGTSLLDIRHSSGAAIANGHVYVNAAAVPGDRSAGLYAYGLPKHPS